MANMIFAGENLAFNPYAVEGLYFWQTYGTENLTPFELVVGETYTVLWDGKEYQTVALTNGELYGMGNLFYGGLGENTGEPFVIGINADGSNTFCITPESGSHSLTIHKGVLEGLILKDRLGDDLIFKRKEKIKIPTKSGGLQCFSKGEAISDIPIELDFSGGNQTVAAPEGMLVKSAIIVKPEGLEPKNIAKDVNVAGIVGTHEGSGFNFDDLLRYFAYHVDTDNNEIIINHVLFDKLYEETGSYELTIPDTINGLSVVLSCVW